VTEHGLGVCGPPRTGGRSPTGALRRLGLNADLQLWVEPLPDQLSARCAGWDGSGLVTTLAGWRWSIHKIRLAQGPGADQPMAPPASSPNPAATAGDGGTISTQPIAAGSMPARAWRSATTRPHTVTVKTSTVTARRLSTFEASTYVPTAVWSAEGLRPSADYASRILQGLAHWPFPAAWRLELTEILGGEPRHNDLGPSLPHIRPEPRPASAE